MPDSIQPAVEILMATYNGGKYLAEQIESILAQTNREWILTISDDGSTDSTPAIIDDYAARYPDRIRRVRSGSRFGNARDHFFWLMRESKASYLLFCDQDDVWLPEKVEKTLQSLRETERRKGTGEPVLVFTDQTPVNEDLTPITDSLMRYQNQHIEVVDYRAIIFSNVVTGCVMGINRSLAVLAAECTDVAATIMHDWWIATVAARFGTVIYLNESTMLYRQHGNNSVGLKNVRSASYIADRLMHAKRVRDLTLNKKALAKTFRQTYEDRLTEADGAFLQTFGKRRSGPFFYWKYRRCIYGFFRLTGMMILG